MGIKGIYRELGQGRRVSLSKLAADSFEALDRPFRIAIDVAIWQFQTQAARGGTNPAIRALFYRLVRLLGTPVQPIFVFDGPHKPAFKRNKRSGRGDGVATAQAKRLIRLFGFAAHDAPGEAEAECALLQQHGIVDAVLSEDVDTIMFGCTKTLRNWSSEGTSSKTPTHVSLYDVDDMSIANLGLDREGMVLVALMSGGDYLPEGIPGCGVKVACEAAKAGFGKSICRLKASDEHGMQAWRASLIHELHTNEKGYFRTRHKALAIPDDFPNLEVLRYYTHPVVSQPSNLDTVRGHLDVKRRDLHLDGLREFTRETFDWDFRIGAIKFIRVLGQALLVHNICQAQVDGHHYVKRISGRRQHFSTDGTRELRLAYVPKEVVPIDLSKEDEGSHNYGRDGLALNSDDEFEATADALDADQGGKAAAGKIFDVAKPDLAWVLENVARKSVPQAVQAWEDAAAAKAAPKRATKRNARTTGSKMTSGMPRGALDAFMRVTKTSTAADEAGKDMEEVARPRLARQPSRSILRPLRTPSPRQTSKQFTLLAAKSPANPTASWLEVKGSSPMTPRLSKPRGLPETILISSSPAGPAPSRPLSPSSPPGPRTGFAGAQERDGPIRPALAKGSRSQGLSRGLSPSRRKGAPDNSASPSSSQGRTLKQTSLDAFVSNKAKPSGQRQASSSQGMRPPPTREQERGQASEAVDEASDESELEPLSSLMAQTQTWRSKRRQQKAATPSPERSRARTGSRKKKLVVPRASAAGFYDEVEVDVDERDARMAREARTRASRGAASGVARWSDVSVIDLTQGD